MDLYPSTTHIAMRRVTRQSLIIRKTDAQLIKRPGSVVPWLHFHALHAVTPFVVSAVFYHGKTLVQETQFHAGTK
jgi:hypothetical protein